MKKIGIRARMLLTFGITLGIIMLCVFTVTSLMFATYLNGKIRSQLSQATALIEEYGEYYSEQSEEYGSALMAEIRRRIYASPDIEAIVVNNDYGQILQNINFDYSLKQEEVEALANEVFRNRAKYGEGKITYTTTAYAKYVLATVSLGTHPKYSDCYVILYSDLTQYDLAVSASVNLLRNTAVISMILLFIAIFVVSETITRSVKKLSNFANDVGHGTFKTRDYNFSVREFHDLSTNMNNMALMLEKSDKDQKQFFQNVSHELRTPLMSIQGYAEGIQCGVFGDDKEAAAIIVDESKRLTAMLEQTLYISKIDLNELKFGECDLVDIIFSAKEKLDGLIVGKEKRVEIDVPQEKALVYGDSDALLRAFINVISNGIRYAKEKVSVRLYDDTSNWIITVEDDGKGISEEDMPHIFDRFYKGKDGKHGIGLSISKSIMDAHSGALTAENGKNGACFTFILKK